jgi:hypothetical protein
VDSADGDAHYIGFGTPGSAHRQDGLRLVFPVAALSDVLFGNLKRAGFSASCVANAYPGLSRCLAELQRLGDGLNNGMNAALRSHRNAVHNLPAIHQVNPKAFRSLFPGG